MLVWFPFSVLLLVSCITDFFYRKISNMLLLVIGDLWIDSVLI